MFRALLHFSVFMAVAVPAFAQVYKWVDERGVTHYGERPPQGRKSTEVPHKLGTPAAPASATRESPAQQDRSPQQGQPQDQDSRQGQAAPPLDKQAQDALRRQEQCNQQRDLLARLRLSAPAAASSGWGPSAPTSSERNAAIARQEKLVAEQCRS